MTIEAMVASVGCALTVVKSDDTCGIKVSVAVGVVEADGGTAELDTARRMDAIAEGQLLARECEMLLSSRQGESLRGRIAKKTN